jgi:hypothetical protein
MAGSYRPGSHDFGATAVAVVQIFDLPTNLDSVHQLRYIAQILNLLLTTPFRFFTTLAQATARMQNNRREYGLSA